MSETNSEPKAPKGRSFKRKLLIGFAGACALGAVASAVVIAQAWTAFGKAPEGERLSRMQASPQHADGVFVNPQPMWNGYWESISGAMDASEFGSPAAPVDVVQVDPKRFAEAPESGLRVTWLGHSTVLLEIDGVRVLTDPVWGRRTSPLTWLGPERWYDPLIALDELPAIDAVLLSHDHYDHLDYPTIVQIKDWDTVFVCPLGVGAHLEYWGVPAERIVEMDWWESTKVGADNQLELVMTPSRHASGRHIFDQMRTLWAGYAMLTKEHRVFFSGDTGLFPGMQEIGDKYGPFDLTMIEVGAYAQPWPDWHIGPEQAIRAHGMLRGEVFMPVHWGLFNLAYHGWTEPIERTRAAAEAAGARLAAPRPGESFEPTEHAPLKQWWPEVPWQSASEYPIVSSKVDENSPVRD